MPDVVVIGAGHNGLVAANLLADRGLDVVVIEGAAEPGGAVRSGPLTLPGFTHDLFSGFYPLAVASPVIASLGLEDHGLTWCRAPLSLAHPLADGRSVAVGPDLDATVARLEADHRGDGVAWREMVDGFRLVGGDLLGALLGPFPPLGRLASLLRQTGAAGAMRLARQFALPVRRLCEERFGGTGAALLVSGCALHADPGPDATGSGAFGLLLACLAEEVGFPVPRGGAGALTGALVDRLSSRGGGLRLGEEVTSIIVRRHRAVGVRTRSGEEFVARRGVVAAIGATRLYGELVAAGDLPATVLEDLGRFDWDPATVKVDWALSAPVPWRSSEVREAGTVHVADDLDELTEYAGELAMGRLPTRPFLVVGQPGRADASRAPAGAETAWAYTHLPHRPRRDGAGELDVSGKGWLDGFVERIEGRLERHAPGFVDLVVGRHVLGPADFASYDPDLRGGAIGGGTAKAHQQLVFRPIPGFSRPETPLAGLYLASSSAHPGAGVHGAPGANAARALLARLPRARSALLGRGGRAALLGRR